MHRIDIISDAICPWCWIGKRQFDAARAGLAEELPLAVRWRPFQLNPDMPAGGVERDSYRAAKFGSVERGRELDANVAAAGAAVGLRFRHDLMRRTPNTIDAHRLLQAAAGDAQHALAEDLFAAYFEQGRDVGDRDELRAIAATHAIDPACLDDAAAAEAVREEDAGYRAAGVSGVPSFAMDGHLLFSGALPAERMAAAFRRAAALLRERAAA